MVLSPAEGGYDLSPRDWYETLLAEVTQLAGSAHRVYEARTGLQEISVSDKRYFDPDFNTGAHLTTRIHRQKGALKPTETATSVVNDLIKKVKRVVPSTQDFPNRLLHEALDTLHEKMNTTVDERILRHIIHQLELAATVFTPESPNQSDLR